MTNDERRMSSVKIRQMAFVLRYVILFVIQCSSFVILTDAETRKIPLQPYRGWWYVRAPVQASEMMVRFAIPYDLPATVHFHVLMLPEKGLNTFVGSRAAWPKGWVWHRGGVSLSLTPLTHSQVIAELAGLSFRVNTAIPASPGLTHTVDWGPKKAFDGYGPTVYTTLRWEYSEMESRFAYHPQQSPPHGAVNEFLRGGWTSWLDLQALVDGAGMPSDATTVLVAIAPFHREGNVDQALNCFPVKGASRPAPLHARSLGDYPNDPTILWNAFHEEMASGGWKERLKAGSAKVYGPLNPDMRLMEAFPQAWSASAMQMTNWSDYFGHHPVDIGIRRASRDVDRYLTMEDGARGWGHQSAKLSGSVVNLYHKLYGAMREVTVSPRPAALNPTGPTAGQIQYNVPGLPVLDTQEGRAWLAFEALNSWGEFSLPGFRAWAINYENANGGFMPHLNEWARRFIVNFSVYKELEYWDLWFALYFAIMEWKWTTDPPTPPPHPLYDWQGPSGAFDTGKFIGSGITLQMNGGEKWESADRVAQDLADSIYNEIHVANVGGGSSENLPMPPIGWAGGLLPPVFGQLQALASPELINLSMAWWRLSAGQLAQSGIEAMTGIALERYPWPGWFPVDQEPLETGPDGWWSRYQASVPWAKLMKEPSAPAWTSPNEWRFTGTSWEWPKRMHDMFFWSPQPPSTRASTDGQKFSSMVLPTAAYLMGPIEIRFKQ